MKEKCLFRYHPQTLETDESTLRVILGSENVFDWGNDQVGIHCPIEGCEAEMEQSLESSTTDYTLSSVQAARAKCLERIHHG